VIEIAPPGSASGARRLFYRVNANALHQGQVEHQSAMARRIPGNTVVSPADRD
jgi:hypothetical protein